MEVRILNNKELKLDDVKIIQILNNCDLEEILFIDDREDVINLLNSNSVNSILVRNIEN